MTDGQATEDEASRRNVTLSDDSSPMKLLPEYAESISVQKLKDFRIFLKLVQQEWMIEE